MLRDGDLLLTAHHSAAGALVTSVAFLKGGFGSEGNLFTRRGGRRGQNQSLESRHLGLKNVNLTNTDSNII